MNEEAMTHWGLLRQQKEKYIVLGRHHCIINMKPNLSKGFK